MSRPSLVLLGGFLGSGKTTLMVEIGKRLAGKGHRVGIVTNDQGEMLVDTAFAGASGFAATDVRNGCFCCNFSTFVRDLDRIVHQVEPDYIIAEPVGSCTDLVATVLTPLTLYHEGLVDLAAFLVLVDAPRLTNEYRDLNLSSPITPREVLVAHQIAEAGHIVLSKIDAVSDEKRDESIASLRDINPTAAVLACSATTGENVDHVLDVITNKLAAEIPAPVPIDYDVYAAAEAEMGWYNGRGEIVARSVGKKTIDGEAIALDIATALASEIGPSLIHGKVLVTTPVGSVKVSVVAGVVQADAAMEQNDPVDIVGLTVNVRATVDPVELAETVARTVTAVCGKTAQLVNYNHRSLIPGAPIPEHRLT